MASTADCTTAATKINGVDLKPIDVDQYSLVRYVHATAMRLQAVHELDESEIEAFCDAVYTPHYTAQLQKQDLIGAWVGGELVATAGWYASDDGQTARIASVFVRPPFTRLGIGTCLVADVEAAARNAGFKAFGLRATGNSVSFFERLGYRVTVQGLKNIAIERGVPITFMRKIVASDNPEQEPTQSDQTADAEG
jgi:N-acetylglutamate synthase-like GNAT family acetyltransferase